MSRVIGIIEASKIIGRSPSWIRQNKHLLPYFQYVSKGDISFYEDILKEFLRKKVEEVEQKKLLLRIYCKQGYLDKHQKPNDECRWSKEISVKDDSDPRTRRDLMICPQCGCRILSFELIDDYVPLERYYFVKRLELTEKSSWSLPRWGLLQKDGVYNFQRYFDWKKQLRDFNEKYTKGDFKSISDEWLVGYFLRSNGFEHEADLGIPRRQLLSRIPVLYKLAQNYISRVRNPHQVQNEG